MTQSQKGKHYMVRSAPIPGTQYAEVCKKARVMYASIQRRTKRRPYVRSAYFRKEKVFLQLFWEHLSQKNWHDRARRIKYFPCALELIQHTRLVPVSLPNPNKHSEVLYRFFGETKDGDRFMVQIKEEKRRGQKWLMSVFPL